MKRLFLFFFVCFNFCSPFNILAQEGYDGYSFNEQDTLRGQLNSYRTCYDVHFYDLDLFVDMLERSIQGQVGIHYTVQEDFNRMQIDLFENMQIDSVVYIDAQANQLVTSFERNGNAFFVDVPNQTKGASGQVIVYYGGKPIIAKNAPWDGGFSWKRDKENRPWLGVSCEGIGASLWWPNKDHLSEESDSTRIRVTVDDDYTVISNGNLRSTEVLDNGLHAFEWFVAYPINNYNVTLNIGNYAHFNDPYVAFDGDTLACDYYVMDYNLEKAKQHFEQVHGVLESFEYFFGKYPFWEDGFALVETPYLGMEHQSCIAYGNKYMRGYLGGMIPADMDWDYIIVHETGHEYFGNSVSSVDHAEMWIHESFTTYMEALYVEYFYEYADVERYLEGQRPFIRNKQSIVGPMDVNFDNWKASDHYYKGSWVIHTLRHHLGDDEFYFKYLKDFYQAFSMSHMTSEDFILFTEDYTGLSIRPIMEHYLYKAELPILRYSLDEKRNKKTFAYRWDNVAEDFNLKVWVRVGEELIQISPSTTEQELVWKAPANAKVRVDLGKSLIDVIEE